MNPFKLRNHFIHFYKVTCGEEYGSQFLPRELKSFKELLNKYDSSLILFAISKYISEYGSKSKILKFANLDFFSSKYKSYSEIARYYQEIFSLKPGQRKEVMNLLEEYEDYLEAVILTGDDARRKKEILEILKEIYNENNTAYSV